MTKQKKYQVIERYRERIKPENKRYISMNLQISNQISELLTAKDWTQKEFAKKLGKQESEVSKWLSGLHNLTLKSITKMEAILGNDIIITPLEACEKYVKIKYVTLRVNATKNQANTYKPKNVETNIDYKNTIREDAA